MNLVKYLISVRKTADGKVVEWVDAGISDRWESYKKATDGLLRPFVALNTKLFQDQGNSVELPFAEPAQILPDRTGILVIFKPGSYIHPDGTDVFPCPNNAAIYNADGSLRCQVHFANRPAWSSDYIIERTFTHIITHRTLPIGRQGEPIDPPIVQFGVLVGTIKRPPESFYVLDTETGALTDGLFNVPY